MPHVEHDVLILPEHLRSPEVFDGIRGAQSYVFYLVCCVLLCVCWTICFILAIVLSVHLRHITLNVLLLSVASL